MTVKNMLKEQSLAFIKQLTFCFQPYGDIWSLKTPTGYHGGLEDLLMAVLKTFSITRHFSPAQDRYLSIHCSQWDFISEIY